MIWSKKKTSPAHCSGGKREGFPAVIGRILKRVAKPGQRKKILLSTILSGILVGLIALYLHRHSADLLRLLKQAEPIFLLPVFGFSGVFFFLTAELNRRVFRVMGLVLGVKEVLSLTLSAFFLNALVPAKAGTLFQIAYLKSVHKFQVTKSLSLFLTVLHLNTVIFSAINLLNLLVIRTGPAPFPAFGPLMIFFGLLLTVSVAAFFVMATGRTGLLRSIGFLERLMEGWRLAVKKPKELSGIIVLLGLVFAVTSLMLYFSFRSQGTDPGVSVTIFLTTINTLSSFINLTPSGLGIQEWLLAAGGTLLNESFLQTMVAALIFRAVWFLIMLSCGIPFVVRSGRRLLDSYAGPSITKEKSGA